MRKITNPDHQSTFRINLGEYWRVLWRKKYFVLVPLVIAVVVSNVGVKFLVPIYESSTVIRVEDGRSVDNEVAQFLGSRRGQRDVETLARLEVDLKGSAFLDELIRHLEMDKDPKLINSARIQAQNMNLAVSAEQLVFRRLRNFVKRRIDVERQGPGLFRISYWDANPEACFAIATAMTNLYIDLQHQQRVGNLREATDFSEEQLEVYRERLRESERRLERFQKQLAQSELESNPVHESNINLTESIRSQINLTITETEVTIDKIRSRLRDLFGAVPRGERVWNDSSYEQLEDRLVGRREAELLDQLRGGGNPQAGGPSIRLEIETVQRDLQRRLAALVVDEFPDANPDFRPLISEYFFQVAELNAHKEKQSRLNSYITSYRNKVALAPQQQTELAKLQQDVTNDRALYNSFMNSKTKTQIREAAQNTELARTIDVVEKASKPFSPVRPNKIKILALAVMFGLSIGAGGLLLTEFSDTSFRSVEEVERELNLKVLGTIPRFEKDHRWYHDKLRKRTVIWLSASVLIMTIALLGFYFYGKSSKEQMLDVNITSSSLKR